MLHALNVAAGVLLGCYRSMLGPNVGRPGASKPQYFCKLGKKNAKPDQPPRSLSNGNWKTQTDNEKNRQAHLTSASPCHKGRTHGAR